MNIIKVNRVLAWFVLVAGFWLIKMAVEVVQNSGPLLDFAVVVFAAIVLIKEAVEELSWKP
jgi:hypothetical protein